MTCSPASSSSATNGVVFQMSMAAMAGREVLAWDSQATLLGSRCSLVTTRSLITPNGSWNIHFHIWAEITVVMAQGMSMAVRIKPRPLKLELITIAMIMPRTNSKIMVITVNFTVTQIELMNCESPMS